MFIAPVYLTSYCRYLAQAPNTYLPPSHIPTCVHTTITVPEVVMCHFPDATPCSNVCLHSEVAVYILYVPNQGCTYQSRSSLRIVGARENNMKQDPCCGPTISECHCTKSSCQVPRACVSLCRMCPIYWLQGFQNVLL
jgi:hypothetical protein